MVLSRGWPGGSVGAGLLALACLGAMPAATEAQSQTPPDIQHANGAATIEGDEDAIFAAAVEANRKRDFTLAYDLFEILADQDVADAQFNLAVLSRQGRGRPQNFRTALFWAWLAHLGDEARAAPLVQSLSESLPPEVRAEVADRLRARLQDQLNRGEAGAILKFARLHAELTDPPDPETAYVWFSIGTALGIIGAIDYLTRLSDGMEMAAILAAQSRAESTFASSAFALGSDGRTAQTPPDGQHTTPQTTAP